MSKLKIVRLPDSRAWFVEATKNKLSKLLFLEDDSRVQELKPEDFLLIRTVYRYGILVTEDLIDDAEWVVFELRSQRDAFIKNSTDGKVP